MKNSKDFLEASIAKAKEFSAAAKEARKFSKELYALADQSEQNSYDLDEVGSALTNATEALKRIEKRLDNKNKKAV